MKIINKARITTIAENLEPGNVFFFVEHDCDEPMLMFNDLQGVHRIVNLYTMEEMQVIAYEKVFPIYSTTLTLE